MTRRRLVICYVAGIVVMSAFAFAQAWIPWWPMGAL